MNVEEIMSIDIETCRAEDTLNRAAQIMWEHDCGVVPVVDSEAHIVGVLTDRDICMAAYTQGRPLSEISVFSACSRIVRVCRAADSIESAEAIMGAAQIHRVPVVDDDDKICGIVSFSDLARRARQPIRRPDGLSYEAIASTVAAISQPSSGRPSNGGSVGRARVPQTNARV
jgi:CBS domain-containing protein